MKCTASRSQVDIYPAKHYIAQEDQLKKAIADIEAELEERIAYFKKEKNCSRRSASNSARCMTWRCCARWATARGSRTTRATWTSAPAGSPPWTLIDYLPSDYLLFIDELHMTIPQIRGMYNGDRSRKQVLADYGFRLPSAMDNRPLKFDEFEQHMGYTIYTSATPGPYEMERADQVVEQIIRPTGLVDPEVEVRPTRGPGG